MKSVFDHLYRQRYLSADDALLGVGSGAADQRVLEEVGLRRVTLTNVEVDPLHVVRASAGTDLAQWERQDAQDLDVPDDSYDFAFACETLHHCRSPHRAATEMLRVARKGIIIVESRDTLAVDVARRVGLSCDYEFNDVLLGTRTHGGADYGPVPNHVYRWTEREFEKMTHSFVPEHDFHFVYFYGLKIPQRLARKQPVATIGRAVTAVAPRQGNLFAMVALRRETKPYLQPSDGGLRLRPEVDGERRSSSTRERVRVR